MQLAYHYRFRLIVGETAHGSNFGRMYTQQRWLDNIEVPLGKFAARVYSVLLSFIDEGREAYAIFVSTRNASCSNLPWSGTCHGVYC